MEKLIVAVHSPEDEDRLFEFVGVDNAGGVIYHYHGKPFSGIIAHYQENKLVAEEEFTDGHIGGVQREYFPSGRMRMEYYKYFGRPEGHWKKWDEEGNLIQHSLWEDGEKIKSILP
jgi:antitoxin component YwqK of YwqJK toxin-antitoxin module